MPAQDEALLRAREHRVQQIALSRQDVFGLPQAQTGGHRDARPLLVREQRLRTRVLGEHALLQAGGEQRPHAPRAQRQRIEHRHRARAGKLASVDLDAEEGLRQLGGARRDGLWSDAAQLAQLGKRTATTR